MTDAGGRRMKRSILVEHNSIRALDPELIESLTKYSIPEHLFTTYEGKQTNLGLFRWFMMDHLRRHPDVNQQMTLLVRLLPFEEMGVPVEFYLYSLAPDLEAFEKFQSGLMEYILTVLPEFGLKIYQKPSAQLNEQVKIV
jgi:miniconductance mechanosensitive channel